MSCFLIQPTGEMTVIEPATRNLDEACAALNSSGIEFVEGVDHYKGEPAQLIVDEDHALKNLPLNNAAIAVRDTAYAAQGMSSADPIFGPALVLTGSDQLR